MSRVLTQEDKLRMKELYEKGYILSEIALYTNTSAPTVRKWLKHQGVDILNIKARWHLKTKARREKALNLLSSDPTTTTVKLAKEIGVTVLTAKRYRNEFEKEGKIVLISGNERRSKALKKTKEV